MERAENAHKLKEADGIFCSTELSTPALLALKRNNLAGSKYFGSTRRRTGGRPEKDEIQALVTKTPRRWAMKL
jgi:hypothetical protein